MEPREDILSNINKYISRLFWLRKNVIDDETIEVVWDDRETNKVGGVVFKKAKKNFSGFELMRFGNLYGKFLKRCTKPETVIEGARVLTKLASSDNKYVKYAAQKVVKDNLINVWQGKEDKLNGQIEKLKKENQDVSALTIDLKTIQETKKQIVDLYNSIKK
jgi:hypothetical protein